jgi:hypothetical protein
VKNTGKPVFYVRKLLEKAIKNMNWAPEKRNSDDVGYSDLMLNETSEIALDDIFPPIPKKKNAETTKCWFRQRHEQSGWDIIHRGDKLRLIPLFMIPYIWCETDSEWVNNLTLFNIGCSAYFPREFSENTRNLDIFMQFQANFEWVKREMDVVPRTSLNQVSRLKWEKKTERNTSKQQIAILKSQIVELKNGAAKRDRKLEQKKKKIETLKKNISKLGVCSKCKNKFTHRCLSNTCTKKKE